MIVATGDHAKDHPWPGPAPVTYYRVTMSFTVCSLPAADSRAW